MLQRWFWQLFSAGQSGCNFSSWFRGWAYQQKGSGSQEMLVSGSEGTRCCTKRWLPTMGWCPHGAPGWGCRTAPCHMCQALLILPQSLARLQDHLPSPSPSLSSDTYLPARRWLGKRELPREAQKVYFKYTMKEKLAVFFLVWEETS